MTIPFVDISDLSDFLGRDVSADPVALLVLDAACQAVRDYISRDVNAQEDDVAVLDGSGTNALLLPQWPITGVLSVDIDDDTVDEDEYYPHEAGMLIRRDSVWPKGLGNVIVIYSHGWIIDGSGEGVVPSSLRMVALRAAQRLFAAQGETNESVTQETIGKYSYSAAADEGGSGGGVLTDLERAALDPYKKP